MNLESIQKANEILSRIKSLKSQRKSVEDKTFFNKTKSWPNPEVIQAGVDAMMATIDESIDAAEKELGLL